MSNTQQTATSVDGEEGKQNFSLLGVIDLIKFHLRYLLRKWWIVLPVIIGITSGYYYSNIIQFEKTYTGLLTISLNEKKSSSSLSTLLNGSAMGLFGGATGAGSEEIGKLGAILKTQIVLDKAILANTSIPTHKGILANAMIDSSLRKSFQSAKDPLLRSFTYFEHHELDSLSYAERRAIFEIHKQLLSKTKGLIVKATDEGLLEIKWTSNTPTIICEVLNNCYEELDRYYSKLKAETKNDNVLVSLRQKRDSISAALAGAQSSIAKYNDQHQAVIFESDRVPAKQLESDIIMMQTIKAQYVSNYEMAKLNSMTNATEGSMLQVLDFVRMPLVAPQRPSRLTTIITGLLFGTILAVGLVIGFKLLSDRLAQERAALQNT